MQYNNDIIDLLIVIETTTHKETPKKKGKKGKKRHGKQRDNSDDDTAGPSRPQVDTTAELPEVSHTAYIKIKQIVCQF